MRLEQVGLCESPWLQRLSLIASGHPGQGRQGLTGGQAGIDLRSASARARSAVTSRKAWDGGGLRP